MADKLGEPTAEDCPFLKVFEQNDAGQWQLKRPDLPEITFSDVDEEAIRAWVESKETEAELQDQKWADAWLAYEAAVVAPWNAFLDQAEQLTDEDI